jgi:segregation and condensation protein A
MTLSLAQDAIALLIDLAEQGEIDPWDVKVIDVIDRFLRELAPMSGSGREQYENNLSQSGQAFLYASMLLLLKAESLAQAETQPEEELEDLEFPAEMEALADRQLPLHLERQIRRRAVAQPPRQRRVTLKELIDQLQLIAATLEETPTRTRPRRARPQSRAQAVRAIAQLAHQENLSELALELEQLITNQWLQISQGQAWLDFDFLLEVWMEMKAQGQLSDAIINAPVHSPNSDRVGVFWALLLLSAQSKVELSQSEFYQDLKIRSLADIEALGIANLSDLSAYALPD